MNEFGKVVSGKVYRLEREAKEGDNIIELSNSITGTEKKIIKIERGKSEYTGKLNGFPEDVLIDAKIDGENEVFLHGCAMDSKSKILHYVDDEGNYKIIIEEQGAESIEQVEISYRYIPRKVKIAIYEDKKDEGCCDLVEAELTGESDNEYKLNKPLENNYSDNCFINVIN